MGTPNKLPKIFAFICFVMAAVAASAATTATAATPTPQPTKSPVAEVEMSTISLHAFTSRAAAFAEQSSQKNDYNVILGNVQKLAEPTHALLRNVYNHVHRVQADFLENSDLKHISLFFDPKFGEFNENGTQSAGHAVSVNNFNKLIPQFKKTNTITLPENFSKYFVQVPM